MTAVRFQSPRQAVQVYFAARSHGPKRARPKWDGMPRSGNFNPADDEAWVAVGAIIYGQAPDGCAVERESKTERDLRRWAEGLIERNAEIEAIEKRMRRRLRAAGLMAKATKWVREELVDDDGLTFTRHVEVTLPDDAEVGGE